MPTYDYRCKGCSHEFELVQSMSAPVKRKCPECGALKLERLIGAGAGFIIKGSAAPTSDVQKQVDDKSSDGGKQETAATKTASEDAAQGASGDTSSAGDAKDTKPSTSVKQDAEKKISGSTSTPTHAAREGRGVGNLVDKAKRRAKEVSKKKGGKKKS